MPREPELLTKITLGAWAESSAEGRAETRTSTPGAVVVHGIRRQILSPRPGHEPVMMDKGLGELRRIAQRSKNSGTRREQEILELNDALWFSISAAP